MQSGTAFGNWVIDEKPTDFAKALYQELTNITEEVDTNILENRFRNASMQEYHFAIQSLVVSTYTIQIIKNEVAILKHTRC